MSLSVSSNWANTHSCIYICISIDYVFLLDNAELVLRIIKLDIIATRIVYAYCITISDALRIWRSRHEES